MDTRPHPTLAERFAAAQDWWRAAGVDCDFGDEPHNWLDRPAAAPPPGQASSAKEAPAKAAAEPEAPPLGGDRAGWPRTLEDFPAWWLAEEALETGGAGARVPPRGAAGAELMVLVPMPENHDRERLLSGPQGKLVANMLSAMGVGEQSAYLAAALPRHASHPDWRELAARQLGAVLAHHVRLVRPRRVLVLGRAMLPLFGHDPAQAGAKSRQIALEGCDVPALVSFGPEALLATPRFRAGLWRGWLDWTEGNA